MKQTTKQGVLLVNLGTPDAPTTDAVKRYLYEFLLDRHVVDLPRWFWRPLLKWVILPKRSPRSAANYAKIWLPEGSPLWVYSQILQRAVAERKPDTLFGLAMTYNQPTIKQQLEQLRSCDTIKIIPLFPQYSTTTTLAIIDQVREIVSHWPTKPIIEYLYDYADDPHYIQAITRQITGAIEAHGEPDALIFSYHGIPVKYLRQRGDTYQARCELTSQHITQALSEQKIGCQIITAYQSRFGKGKWTEPNIVDVLDQLAREGAAHVQVICPGFAVDCLETLEEIAQDDGARFLAAGGKTFHYIPALNASPAHSALMAHLLDSANYRFLG